MVEKEPLKILQITDTHLFKNNEDELFGVKTNLQLKKLIDYLLIANVSIDRIFLTGDVSQDMSPESYRYAISEISRLKKPVFWIPGNHDDYKIMASEFSKHDLFDQVLYFKTYDRTFIFINTKYKDVDSGYFSDSDRGGVRRILSGATKYQSICLVMHHHPVKTDTPLIDKYILENDDQFWNLIDQHPAVKNIICGHVHGDYTIKRKDVTVHASMASCFQFVKGSEKLVIDKTIGCKLYEFDGGSLKTKSITVDESLCSVE